MTVSVFSFFHCFETFSIHCTEMMTVSEVQPFFLKCKPPAHEENEFELQLELRVVTRCCCHAVMNRLFPEIRGVVAAVFLHLTLTCLQYHGKLNTNLDKQQFSPVCGHIFSLTVSSYLCFVKTKFILTMLTADNSDTFTIIKCVSYNRMRYICDCLQLW